MQHSAAQARYLTPDLSGLPYMDKSGAEIRLGPPQVPTLDRVIVTMALGAVRNYGHLVCDCLSTSAVLSALPELAGYRYAFPTLKPWQKRHLELVGIGFPTELDGPLYRVADVIFSSGMRRFLHHPNVNYRTLRDVELRSCARGSRSFRRIYVSRAEITRKFPLLRRFLSEHKVQERLSEWGFTILTPENHSVDEQIDLFNKAEVIVGCSGAAMANTMYCAPGTTVVEIMPIVDGLSGQRWVQNICAINGLRWGPYFCAGYRPEPEIRQGRSHLGYSFDANVDDLVAFIRGFL
jgi:capsular polysaccharide biosynthesis protein